MQAKKVTWRKYYLQKRLVGIVNVVSTKRTIYVLVEENTLTKLQVKHIEALRQEYDYVLQFEMPLIKEVPALPKPKNTTRKAPPKKLPKQLNLFNP